RQTSDQRIVFRFTLSNFGWMNSAGNPESPRAQRNRMIQVERRHRSTATHSQADDSDAIIAPLKMLAPFISSWVEEAYPFACLRISGAFLLAFEVITERAAQA